MLIAPAFTEEESEVRAGIQELSDSLALHVRQGNRWTAPLRRMTFARNVQGSNSIEGINASVDDIAAIAQGETPATINGDTERALIGYQLAMTYVLQLAQDPVTVDTTLIRSLHYMVTSYDLALRPGRYRVGPVYVQREATGDIVHEGAPHHELPELMHQLTHSLHQSGDRLVDAAMAHLNFVLIHPFKDGNGRMARVLQSLVLASDNDISPVFLSTEEYLGRHTRAYYDVLAQVGGGTWPPGTTSPKEVRPWLRFTLTAHYNQALERASRIEAASAAVIAIGDLLNAAGVDDRAMDALFDALFGATITRARYMSSLAESGIDISTQTATRDLTALAHAGLLMAVGERRGRVYAAADTLLALRREVGLGRAWRHVDPFARLQSNASLT